MIRTRSILGATLLSALAVCAIGVSSASALTMHECVESQVGTGAKYKDAKCSEASAEGKFETVPIPTNTSVKLEGTLTPTTGGMNATAGEEPGTHAVVHYVLGGIPVRITCEGLSTPSTTAENKTTGPEMEVVGTGIATFTECAITGGEKAAANCELEKPTLETFEISATTEGDRVVLKPKGPEFITVVIKNRGPKTCPAAIVGNNTFGGVVRGTAASPTALEFTSESGSELKVKESPAQFTAVIHFKTKGTETQVALETP